MESVLEPFQVDNRGRKLAINQQALSPGIEP
jgi:hypothetical protein